MTRRWTRDELVELKAKLERDIAAQVSSLVEEFKSTTGFSVNYVSISLEEATTIGSRYSDYVVSKVKADICI